MMVYFANFQRGKEASGPVVQLDHIIIQCNDELFVHLELFGRSIKSIFSSATQGQVVYRYLVIYPVLLTQTLH